MQPGTVVGERFAIEREAGAGGMGTVYAARDRVTGARVALKVLVRTSAVDTERFVREAEALAETDHPSVVRYVAHGTTPSGQLYIAMEWLEGEDLSTRIAESGLTIAETVRVVHHVADALAALHRRGIIHRDIKPSNVFLVAGDVDRIKLLDLGIARIEQAAVTLTRAGALVGTPGYMAPEQARGQSDVSPRADIFALGCVLFECLTGRPAFQGENVMALLAKILLADPPRPREVRPDVPAALDELCAWMLRKDPDERPANAGEVIAALANLELFDAPAPMSQGAPRRTPALTSSEQRLVCLLLAGAGALGSDPNESLAPTMSSDAVTAELAVLRTRVTAVGVRIDRLADGSLLGIGQRDVDASEQAVATARAALLLRAEMPNAPIAVATGRGDVSSPVPVGEVIDRAARLFQISKHAAVPRPVIIDDVTAGLVHERFDVARRGSAYALLSELQDTRAGARTVLGKETPFVGRDREIAMLDGLVSECASEPAARAVLVTAAPGIGKSRLRREIVTRASAELPNLSVWMARGDPMQTGSPFSLLGGLLRDAFGIAAGESLEARRAKVRAGVELSGVADVDRVAAFLCELAGAAHGDERVDVVAARRDPQLMNDQLRAAWTAWLDAETRAHPVMLVLEDLQWGDAPTVSFVDDALRLLAERPLFVLAIARPEVARVFPKIWADRNVQPLPLRELSRKASETLARHVLGANVAASVVGSVVTRAAGNAFFLEELLRSAAERGDLGAMPETVLAMVESRLDALDPDARRVLRAASVFGETFHAGGVAALLGQAEAGIDVGAWLDVLARSESIVARDPSSIPGEREFAFRHALVRDAAYAMLTDKDRALGHVLAGTWLESKGASDAALLAEHYARGGSRSRAAFWFLRAAWHGMAGNNHDGVMALLDRGLACADAPADRAALLLASAEARRWRAEYALVERAAKETIALVAKGSDEWWSAIEKLVDSASKLNRVDDVSRVVKDIEGAIAAAPPISRHVVSAVAAAATALVDLGQYETARRLIDWSKDATERALANDALSAALVAVARSRYDLAFGDIFAFRQQLGFAKRAYEEAGAMRHICRSMGSDAYGAMLLGRYADAADALRGALAIATSLGAMSIVLGAKHNLGLALLRSGDLDGALEIETDALALAREQKTPRLEGACLYYLSLIAHARGNFDDAIGYAEESVRVCALVPPSLAEALAALAQARLAKGDRASALAATEEAMRILREVGGIDEGEPFIRLIHAEALHATGASEASRAAIEDARAHVEARASKLTDEGARATFYTVWENARTRELARAWQSD